LNISPHLTVSFPSAGTQTIGGKGMELPLWESFEIEADPVHI
jgi:hypothetical protein